MVDESKDLSDDLRQQVVEAYRSRTPLRIIGGDTKKFYGNELLGNALYTNSHIGIINYEPGELVITARAGTPLLALESILLQHNQILGFEPPGFGASATIGGVVASGLSGPRRPFAGSVRDNLLGCKVITGTGDIVEFGGRVLKNAAGYDVSRLMVGAMGTLGVLLEVSLKVQPQPNFEATLYMPLKHQEALDVMNARLAKPLPITGACYDGETLYLRLSSWSDNFHQLRRRVAGDVYDNANLFWTELREQQHYYFRDPSPLWRLSLASGTLHLGLTGEWFFDWGGALRWLKSTQSALDIRNTLATERGHAILFRQGDAPTNRENVAAFHPLPLYTQVITRKLKRIFDPGTILNRNRLYRDDPD